VILLNGRYAGRKAVVVKAHDQKTKKRPYGHALIAGIAKYPRRVTKSMTKYTIMRRSTVKPFVKFINYNHVMPTRSVSNSIKSINQSLSFLFSFFFFFLRVLG
jgi:large subunit ribosomal protein L27e